VDVDSQGGVHVAGTGKNQSGNDQAFYYEASSGTFTPIPFLNGGASSIGRAIQVHSSGDVRVVGRSNRSSPLPYHAFLWKKNEAVESNDLGDTPTDPDGNGNNGDAYCLGYRPNGATVVRGSTSDSGYPCGGHSPMAFSWYSGDSTNYALWWTLMGPGCPVPAGTYLRTTARGTSKDGTWLVGSGTFDSNAPTGQGSICESNRMAYLSNTDEKDEHYWTLQLCVVPGKQSRMLGFVPGHEGYSEGWGVSNGGQTVVGVARKLVAPCTWGEPNSVAFIWDATNGMRDLKTVLEDYGLDLTGWTLTEARAISDDGTVICGLGVHNGQTEGWVATIGRAGPYSACCRPDGTCAMTTLPDCDGEYHPGGTCEDTACCNKPFSDDDRDGDVDMDDFARFQRCVSIGQAGVTPPLDCQCWDIDGNNSIDDDDFTRGFMICGTGPGVAADPLCQ
jgi:hypothetical protein